MVVFMDCCLIIYILCLPLCDLPIYIMMRLKFHGQFLNKQDSLIFKKKKVDALSTITYTEFECNIDKATLERLEVLPLVNWVLPNEYGDPELVIFAGDRYTSGVITLDSNPSKPYNKRLKPRYER